MGGSALKLKQYARLSNEVNTKMHLSTQCRACETEETQNNLFQLSYTMF